MVMSEFSLLHVVFGVHPTSYPMNTGGSFLEVKRPGREGDHSPPTSAEVKKMRIYTSTPPYSSIIVKHRDKFTFYLTVFLCARHNIVDTT
jgi:hypothetical protein